VSTPSLVSSRELAMHRRIWSCLSSVDRSEASDCEHSSNVLIEVDGDAIG